VSSSISLSFQSGVDREGAVDFCSQIGRKKADFSFGLSFWGDSFGFIMFGSGESRDPSFLWRREGVSTSLADPSLL